MSEPLVERDAFLPTRLAAAALSSRHALLGYALMSFAPDGDDPAEVAICRILSAGCPAPFTLVVHTRFPRGTDDGTITPVCFVPAREAFPVEMLAPVLGALAGAFRADPASRFSRAERPRPPGAAAAAAFAEGEARRLLKHEVSAVGLALTLNENWVLSGVRLLAVGSSGVRALLCSVVDVQEGWRDIWILALAEPRASAAASDPAGGAASGAASRAASSTSADSGAPGSGSPGSLPAPPTPAPSPAPAGMYTLRGLQSWPPLEKSRRKDLWAALGAHPYRI